MHYVMLKAGFLNGPVNMGRLPLEGLKTLQGIWHAKIVRRVISFLVRTPVRRNILKLVNFNIPIPAGQGLYYCDVPYALEKIISSMVS